MDVERLVLHIQAALAEIDASCDSKEIKSLRSRITKHKSEALRKGREMARWRRLARPDDSATQETELTEDELTEMIENRGVPWDGTAFDGSKHGLYMYHGRRLHLAKADYDRCREELKDILPVEVPRLARWVARMIAVCTDVSTRCSPPSNLSAYPAHISASVGLRQWSAYEFWLQRHCTVMRGMQVEVDALVTHVQSV